LQSVDDVLSVLSQVVSSEHGLLTTVAYQLGSQQPACYALEVHCLPVGLHISPTLGS